MRRRYGGATCVNVVEDVMKELAWLALLVVLPLGCSGKTESKTVGGTTREEAVAAIKKLGGIVKFDEKSPGKPVVYVQLRGLTNAALVHLKGLTNLQTLILYGCTEVTDAGLEHLKGLMKLQRLTLYYTNITDEGLVHLKGLTKLNVLYFNFTTITDAGLEHLKGLTNLQRLDLDNTHVTDEGVKKLQTALPNCRIRHKHRASFTDTSPQFHFQGCDPALNLC